MFQDGDGGTAVTVAEAPQRRSRPPDGQGVASPTIGNRITRLEDIPPEFRLFLVATVVVLPLGQGLYPVYLYAGPQNEPGDDPGIDEINGGGCPFDFDCAAVGCPRAKRKAEDA